MKRLFNFANKCQQCEAYKNDQMKNLNKWNEFCLKNRNLVKKSNNYEIIRNECVIEMNILIRFLCENNINTVVLKHKIRHWGIKAIIYMEYEFGIGRQFRKTFSKTI